MERAPLKLEIVAADRMVWEGEAVNVIARTRQGDIGILPGHEPLMAALVPCMVEIVSADGRAEILAIDGGFIAVGQGHVRILSHEARLSEEISLEAAQQEAHELRRLRNEGDATDAQIHRLHILNAQIRVGERVSSGS
ncbi:F0F1 ATP synthase subunit epsilon [Arachnia propionica]|uniref:ATP synthase epsilon chain n=1 Tax=Arachnia propionica TaxID=1750 RepID=A0A3P1TDV0_9ACTN|nr:F0F1 ATP synthase subunit epsilon [Arachnia propionica]RRD07076.1 F0F1 ATP synthase subunit epsilon [Arachnia propionica]